MTEIDKKKRINLKEDDLYRYTRHVVSSKNASAANDFYVNTQPNSGKRVTFSGHLYDNFGTTNTEVKNRIDKIRELRLLSENALARYEKNDKIFGFEYEPDKMPFDIKKASSANIKNNEKQKELLKKYILKIVNESPQKFSEEEINNITKTVDDEKLKFFEKLSGYGKKPQRSISLKNSIKPQVYKLTPINVDDDKNDEKHKSATRYIKVSPGPKSNQSNKEDLFVTVFHSLDETDVASSIKSKINTKVKKNKDYTTTKAQPSPNQLKTIKAKTLTTALLTEPRRPIIKQVQKTKNVSNGVKINLNEYSNAEPVNSLYKCDKKNENEKKAASPKKKSVKFVVKSENKSPKGKGVRKVKTPFVRKALPESEKNLSKVKKDEFNMAKGKEKDNLGPLRPNKNEKGKKIVSIFDTKLDTDEDEEGITITQMDYKSKRYESLLKKI